MPNLGFTTSVPHALLGDACAVGMNLDTVDDRANLHLRHQLAKAVYCSDEESSIARRRLQH
ncbi:hypothetical protein Y039_259 [Burkholderia pseudomallei MSHR1029]|nr:hypothetical protein Y039_259 [Burkholderia pseudomallei MSHR1029]KKC15083.1 hypothetical protein BBL_2547 [Burkholderia pseudomallei MSHR1328]